MVNSALRIRSMSFYVYVSGFIVTAVVLLCFGLIHSKSASAAVDTCTWTGLGGDAKTTTAGNWSGCDNGNVPENGDNLVFPSGPTNKAVTLDSAVWFESLTISGSSYTINPDTSETLGVYTNTTISGNNNTINTQLRLYPTTTVTFANSGTGTVVEDYIVIQPLAASTDIVFDIDADVTLPMIAQTAPGGGSSIDTVTKTGVGTLDISGVAISGMTAGGGIHIQEGSWQCNSTHCLGSDANVITLDDGADPDGPSLLVNGDDTFAHPITVNTGDGEDGSVHIGAEVTLSGAITGTTNLNMFVSGDNTATVSSNISMANGTTLVLYGVDGYTTNKYVFNGIISGNADIIVDDAHVRLASTNTYTGTTELNDTGSGSLLTVVDNNSLGNDSGGTIVNPGNTLEFNSASGIGFGEPLTVGGTGVGGAYPGALVKTALESQIEGDITLTADTLVHNDTSELFRLDSQISGDYNLTLTADEDDGGFSFAPNSDNSFNNLIVNGARVLVYGPNFNVIPGNLTLNAVDGEFSRVSLNSDNIVANNSIITLNNDTTEEAVLASSGVIETVGTIAGDGTVSMLDSDSAISVGGGGVSGEFTGKVEGFTNSQFQIIGGVWTFSGYNTDAGNGFSSYYVNGGQFIANAADTSLSMSPFSVSSGILGGTELIGPVSVYAGTIAPGNSPGCLYPAGDVAFNDTTSFLSIEINGTTACSGYDVLNASGSVVLNGAVLNVDILADYDSVYGNEFTIVRGAVVAGTFNGLADGDTFTAGNNEFRVNYTATTVTLTDITPADSSTSSLADTGASIYLIALAVTPLLTPASYLTIKRLAKVGL